MTLKQLGIIAAVLVGSATAARAASHSDAPLIKQDPQANITDVYTFLGTRYNNPNIKVLNVIVHCRPFSEPGDGVTYDRFADDALYSIHIANPATGAPVARYDFQFSSVSSPQAYRNLDTILSYGRGANVGGAPNVGAINQAGDARQNFVQTYKVFRSAGQPQGRVIGTDLLTPPPNVGRRTTPAYNDANGRAVSGAAAFADLDVYTRQTVANLPNGEACFAGPREDGFFADIPGIFDLLDPRILGAGGAGQNGNGVDGFKGYNVLAFALQIPVSDLPALPYNGPFFGKQTGVGVYASVSRKKVRILSDRGPASDSGPWVQVNRMGNPLFNEGLVALRDKDNYNRTPPTVDAARYAQYARAPELIVLLNATFGTNFVTANRADLQAVYIPDVLRVNTSTAPVRLAGQTGFSRLGFIGGDTTNGISGGWPNGRRLGDDVVDIALTAIASGPAYTTITTIGDNIAGNDIAYHRVFPYSATPHAGPTNRKDP